MCIYLADVGLAIPSFHGLICLCWSFVDFRGPFFQSNNLTALIKKKYEFVSSCIDKYILSN